MKISTLWIVCFLCPYLMYAQQLDSSFIKQVDSLIKVSRGLIAKRNFEQALEVNVAAEKIALEKLGKESPAYGDCCFNHGRILKLQRDFPGTEKWYLEAKSIREKALGKDHPNYANSLNSLAILYNDMGQAEKAEPLYLESKAIREKVLGKEHPDYAQSLNNLGNLYSDRGQYEKAEPLYLEAKVTRERVLGKEHPDFITSLNNLASHYFLISQYDKAEPLYLEAKDICEKVLGKEHPDYAQSLGNLAFIYTKLGQNEKAELLLLESKAIFEKALGKEHPIYAQSLNLLAILYDEMSQYDKAEPLYQEAKAIQEKALGKDHPNYASSLNNLAILYGKMGQYVKAEPLLLEAKAIQEKAFGKEHSEIANSLNNLAKLYWIMGQSEKVESLYLESKAIREKALGKEHPDYVASQHNLAILYCSMHLYEKAEPIFMELSTVNKLLAERAMRHLSEKELNNYLNLFSISQSEILSFVHISKSQKAVTASFDNTLFYKGFLLNAANKVKRLALTDTTSTKKYNLLKSYEHRLAIEYSKPITERRGVEELEEKANVLEKDLTRTVAGYGEAMRQVNWQEVKSKLKEGEAAIEFVHYNKMITDSMMYAALVLINEMSAPVFVPLFEEKELKEILSKKGEWNNSELLSKIYTRGVKPIVAGNNLDHLYELFWKPLIHLFPNTKTIYYSPSGLLHRINFNAIPIDDKTNLSDKFKLVRLGSTRSLVVPDLINVDASNLAVLFGGINYNMDTTSIKLDSNRINLLASKTDELSFSYASRGIKEAGSEWVYLPGTKNEINSASKLFKKSKFETIVYSGNYATEEAFKNIGKSVSSPRVLHISTHGFFFPDRTISATGRMSHDPANSSGTASEGTAKATSPRVKEEFETNESAFKISDHPMIRSGLILAGGNYAWTEGRPFKEGMEDGILTAYEISKMNLSNTELVVLSACETGLGDIQGNEGVYGLQRAFKIAGAKYLIMSLWQVPDNQTSLLMTTFYKKWLTEKMSIPDAFHEAQKELRDNGLDPYQWAGFVLVE
ncbi:MAG: CHAT domain-containing tetratricopeptide repeat protein [Saprospiraceae bacterium]